MKKLLTLLLFALPIIAKAQITDPVSWNFSAKRINTTTYEVQMKATIESSWHLYGQDAGEGPAEPTAFSFSNNPLLSINGKIAERGKLQKTFDKIVKAEVKYYEKEVTFVQTIKIKGKAATKLNGTVSFMACDDHQCLPAKEVPFTVSVGNRNLK